MPTRKHTCTATPVIREVVEGFLTVTCPGCRLNYSVPKTAT